MNVLFFDTETTGFVRRGMPWDHPSQPRVVQLAAVMQSEPGVDICSLDVILRHDGLEIPEGAAEIHGITTERMMDVGIAPGIAVPLFHDMAMIAESHVAHNVAFDLDMLRIEFCDLLVEGLQAVEELSPQCTMRMATNICRLPPTDRMLAAGRKHFKSPNLTEAHEHFFGKGFDDAHSGIADCRACAAVYWAIQERTAA